MKIIFSGDTTFRESDDLAITVITKVLSTLIRIAFDCDIDCDIKRRRQNSYC